MTKQAVIGIVATREQAEATVGRLRDAGFTDDAISVLFPDTNSTRDFAYEHSTKAPEGAIAGVGAGGALGGTFGLLLGLGTIVIPGLGAFIAAGPLLAALSGAAAGAAVGGITGALIGLGIPEIEAKQYEGQVIGGKILMAVHCENAQEKKRAKKTLEDSHATHVSVTGEARAKKAS